nr:unnamed protein product [Callosobruchus analis]
MEVSTTVAVEQSSVESARGVQSTSARRKSGRRYAGLLGGHLYAP